MIGFSERVKIPNIAPFLKIISGPILSSCPVIVSS